MSNYLKRHFKDPKVASFFSSLATGDIDERALSLEFGKIGVNHLLAISGFHFALLTTFCSFILGLFLPRKTTTILLLIVLSAYFFFVGNAPSVQRAWIGIFIFLIGSLFDLRSNALNSLGCALCIEILIDPYCVTHLGFQLSFLATLAILLLYAPCEKLLSLLLPKRPLSLLAVMTPLHQTGHLFSSMIRKALALNIAVHLVTLPVLLFVFLKFPWLSLLYNLFFPFWVGLSIFLFYSPSFFRRCTPSTMRLHPRSSNSPHTHRHFGNFTCAQKPSPTQWSLGCCYFSFVWESCIKNRHCARYGLAG